MDNNLATLMIDVSLDALRQLDLAEQDAANATATVSTVRTILATYRTSAAATNADPGLSDVGKASAISNFADKAQRELQGAGAGQLAKIAASITGLEALLYPPVVPKDDSATVALLIERRTVLRDGRDALENTVALIDAARTGDTLTFRAITEAPPFDLAFRVDGAAVLAARQVAAEREKPEVGISLKALRSAYLMLQALIADAAREIGGLPDPLLVAAGVSKGNGVQAAAGA
jgi:hypothetical protein